MAFVIAASSGAYQIDNETWTMASAQLISRGMLFCLRHHSSTLVFETIYLIAKVFQRKTDGLFFLTKLASNRHEMMAEPD